jgi:hypothetical protein
MPGEKPPACGRTLLGLGHAISVAVRLNHRVPRRCHGPFHPFLTGHLNLNLDSFLHVDSDRDINQLNTVWEEEAWAGFPLDGSAATQIVKKLLQYLVRRLGNLL